MQILKFFRQIIIEIGSNVFKKTSDNYDFHRFQNVEKKPEFVLRLYINKMKKCAWWLINTGHFLLNIHKFFKSYQLLSDQESKKLFIRLIVYKILGWKRIKIKNNRDWNDEKESLLFVKQFYASPSEVLIKSHPLFGGLSHYKDIPTESGKISLDCWAGGIACIAMKKQYYFERNGITIKPEPGDVVIDGGGCFGDTSIFFAKSVGADGLVYVFDPLSVHGVVISKNILQNNLGNQVTYFSCAISEFSNNTKPTEDLAQGLDPGFRLSNDTSFPMMSIDDFVRDYHVNKLNFIKMDIEGHELSALKGAVQAIKKFKPKLAISIYHRREDFYAIPLWISQAWKDYDFYIDHYTMHAEETVLYAIPNEHSLIKNQRLPLSR